MAERSILIVEDDPGAAEAFEPMLRGRGYHVRVASDAHAGLEEIARSMPSALLVDLHLPLVDGIEFLRRLRATTSPAALPAAVITGDYLVDERVSGELRSLGARLYFKPLWEEDLIRIVAGLLGSDPRPRA